ncbi:MAG: penicillin-binding protein activator [Alphaproteobacteria bacterium]|nr:penicillin-binding protein activator [Alphaproteobacteria bacterium]
MTNARAEAEARIEPAASILSGRRRILGAAIGIVATAALAGCGGTVAGGGLRPQASLQGPSSSAPLVAPPPAAAAPPSELAQTGAPRVGLLLPLTGPNAALGTAMRDAAQMAVADNADRNFRLITKDTGGTPDGAARAAQEAIAEGARLLVGPLLAAEAQSVAPIAAGAGINMITLSNDRSVASPSVFVLGLTPRQEIDRVVSFARSRGVQRFAAMLPNNAYGNAAEEAVRAAIGASGGELTKVERYETSGDPTPQVQSLTGQVTRPVSGRAPVDFEAVIIPDQGGRVLTVAPLLQFYGVEVPRVRILGSSLMRLDPRVMREPALVGAWFAAPSLEARADFDRRFRETTQRDAPPLATLAYDAVAVAAVLAKSRGGDFSTATITAPQGFAGMDGAFRFNPDGTAERALAVLEIQRDGMRTVSPAATSFETPSQ